MSVNTWQLIACSTGIYAIISVSIHDDRIHRDEAQMFHNFQAAVMLLKNDEMVETVWAESIPYWSSSSNTAILDLTSGDQVWPVLLSRAPYMHGYMYSTFSGFLLYNAEEPDKSEEKRKIPSSNGLPDVYGPP